MWREELTYEWRGENVCLEEVDWRERESENREGDRGMEGYEVANKHKSFGVAFPVSKEQSPPSDR